MIVAQKKIVFSSKACLDLFQVGIFAPKKQFFSFSVQKCFFFMKNWETFGNCETRNNPHKNHYKIHLRKTREVCNIYIYWPSSNRLQKTTFWCHQLFKLSVWTESIDILTIVLVYYCIGRWNRAIVLLLINVDTLPGKQIE